MARMCRILRASASTTIGSGFMREMPKLVNCSLYSVACVLTIALITDHTLPLPDIPSVKEAPTNHLPAISWSIGVYEPQKYLWIVFILIATIPRIAIGPLYEAVYRSTNASYANHWLYIVLCKLVHYLTVIEYATLIVVSIVPINKHFGSKQECSYDISPLFQKVMRLFSAFG